MKARMLALAAAVALAAPAHADWARSWAASVQQPDPPRPGATATPTPLAGRTIRQVVRLSSGGARLRVQLSNEMGDAPLHLRSVRVGLLAPDGALVQGSERQVTFAGAPDATIPAGAPLLSDPVPLAAPAPSRLVVSFLIPEDVPHPTVHPLGRATAVIRDGDTGLASGPGRNVGQRWFLSAVDVDGPRNAATVVTLGDSITDGARATVDADHRWPDILAERLQHAGLRNIAVANEGISGNRVLKDVNGPNALARLDRDVLSAPNVRWLIVLEGINDIGKAARDHEADAPSAADIITGYRQIIDRAHAHGVRVLGATILPYRGAPYFTEDGDAVRRQVNAWIRAPGHFDGLVDFERAVADPADPSRIAKPYDGGDALHPSDAGYKAMGEAIDLKLFRR